MNESANSLIANLLLTPPQSKTELFTTFFKMGLQGFGAVLAAVKSDLVQRKRWMTKAQFVEECAQAQLMPGPNLVNLCLMIGGRYFGIQHLQPAAPGRLSITAVCPSSVAMAFPMVRVTKFPDPPGG